MLPRVVYLIVLVRCWSMGQEAVVSGNELWSGDPCLSNDENGTSSVACQGLGIVRRVVAQLLDERKASVRLTDGIELVKVANPQHLDLVGDESEARGGGGFWKGVQRFLMEHELRFRLPELMPNVEDLGFPEASELKESGRKAGGKGGGGLLALALMMKGTLAAIGLGGLGLLAMKALMVSAMALMLSAIVGIKKLSSKDEGGGHYVVHAGGGDHHRRKRETEAMNLAYRAYLPK